MAASLVVVVLVALADTESAATQTMGATAEQTLGDNAWVVVRGVESTPTNADAEKLETLLHANALVEVTWPSRDRAHLHVHAGDPETWTDRDVDFGASDDVVERGRALGLVLATMIPPAKEKTTKPIAETTPSTTTTTATSTKPPVFQPILPPPSRAALDVVAAASHGIGGSADAIGGELGLRYRVATSFEVRAGGGARLGDIPSAGASARTYRIDAGGAWTFLSFGARPLAFGARLDLVLLRHSLSRPTPDDRDVSRDARWLLGSDLLLESGWSFVPDAALVFDAGTEIAFGTTRVFNQGVEVAVIPRVRLLFELGLRARF